MSQASTVYQMRRNRNRNRNRKNVINTHHRYPSEEHSLGLRINQEQGQ